MRLDLNLPQRSNLYLTGRKENPLKILNKKSNKVYNNVELKVLTLPKKMQDMIIENSSIGASKISQDTALSSMLKFIQCYLLRNKTNGVELLYLIRPILYLSSLIYFGKRSVYPLAICGIIDLITFKVNRPIETFTQSKIYTSEMLYRMSGMTTYLLREPIFSILTKPFLLKLLKILRIPQSVINLILDLIAYYTNIYFLL
jgi:hypothetical protein